MRIRFIVPTTLAALAIVVTAGCGSSDSGSQASAPTSVATVATTAPAGNTQPASDPTSSPSSDETVASHPADTTSAPAPTASSTATHGSTSDGEGPTRLNVKVFSVDEVSSKLGGTSSSFQRYITSRIADEVKTEPKGCKPEVDVDHYWADDQAMGGIGACGGARTFWYRTSSGWHELGYNGDLECNDMRRKGVPHAIPTSTGFKCWVKDSKGGHLEPYTPAS